MPTMAGMRFLLAALFIASAATGGAQTVFIGGPPEPDYCLKLETIKPNLEAKRPVYVSGRITDITGAVFKNSTVQLKRYVSQTNQVPIKTVKTDANGSFELGLVEKGQYRLLASPNRGFRQPEELDCGSSEVACSFIVVSTSCNVWRFRGDITRTGEISGRSG